MTFAQEKPKAPEWFVSYAWGDKSPEGVKRETIVDQLCAEALTKGRVITRDKNVMRLGDRISSFMARIGAGDRIFVILSDKYMRSPFCMFELTEIWRQSRQDKVAFRDRVRFYALPDTAIWTSADRRRWAIHWKKEHDAIEADVRDHGHGILGEAGHRDWMQMQRFSMQVGDILDTPTDVVQPRTLDELAAHGFDP